MNFEALLDPKDLAERWRLRTATLATWRSQGCGPKYFKFGSMIRYRLRDIENYEREHFLTDTSGNKGGIND